MKKLKLFGLLSLLSILFMGCPYTSEVAIDNPSVKIEPKMLGQWESKNSETDKYSVTKADDYTYNIEKKSSSSITHYKAYESVLNGTKFLNLWEDSASTKTFYLYKYELSGSGAKITLKGITDNITEKFTSSADLKKFILANMGLSFFYDKEDEVYIRAD